MKQDLLSDAKVTEQVLTDDAQHILKLIQH